MPKSTKPKQKASQTQQPPVTAYAFPERCSLGIIEGKAPGTSLRIKFGILELFFVLGENVRFDEIFEAVRKSRSVRLNHLPYCPEEEITSNDSTLLLSFHQTRANALEFEEPLFAAIIRISENEDIETLAILNDQLIADGHFCITLQIESYLLVLSLIEVHAVAAPIQEKGFRSGISGFIGEPRYYAEYQPPLDDPLDQLVHSVIHYRESISSQGVSGSVNLTGLIPEGLA